MTKRTPALARRSAILLLALVSAVLGLLGSSAHPAAAADSTNYGIRSAESADHFRVELAPGAATKHTAIVSNRSSKKVTFKVYAADALTTKQGGFALRSAAEPRTAVAKWAKLASETVTISAGSQKEVPFRLSIPATATPGDYAGAIILEAPPRRGRPGEVGDETAVQLNVVERVGVRVYVKVAGTARARLSAGRMNVEYKDSAIAFTVPVTNTGNVILQPVVTGKVRGRVGANKKLTFTPVEELLPGETVTVHATWRAAPRVIWGEVDATIEHAGGIERVQTALRRVPVIPMAIIGAVLLLALWLCVWAIRTVLGARRVLRHQPSSLKPVPRSRRKRRNTSHGVMTALR